MSNAEVHIKTTPAPPSGKSPSPFHTPRSSISGELRHRDHLDIAVGSAERADSQEVDARSVG
jgi:hypothetical protein